MLWFEGMFCLQLSAKVVLVFPVVRQLIPQAVCSAVECRIPRCATNISCIVITPTSTLSDTYTLNFIGILQCRCKLLRFECSTLLTVICRILDVVSFYPKISFICYWQLRKWYCIFVYLLYYCIFNNTTVYYCIQYI